MKSRWSPGSLQNLPVIRVVYARRFGPGKCVLALLVPPDNVPIGKIRMMRGLQENHPHPPELITYGRDERCLRIVYPLPDMRPEDQERILKCARILAGWAKDFFEMQAVVSPVDGLIEARQKLDLL